MRIQRPNPPFLMTLCLLFCFLLGGCASQGTSISQGASATQPAHGSQAAGTVLSQADRAVPPVILHDPTPGELEVVFNVNMGGYGADRDKTMIGLSFLSHGNVVQLVGHEQLMCNGKAMPVHQQYAVFQLADAPTRTLEGKTMSCMYRVGNTSTTFSFTVPRAPIIRSPQDLAQVPQKAHTLISYHVQGGKLLGIVALGAGAKAIAHLDTPGIMQATVDTSTFPPGDGSIALTQTLDPQATQTGGPFKSFGAAGTAMTTVAVTWV